jgi:hypothetical protein
MRPHSRDEIPRRSNPPELYPPLVDTLGSVEKTRIRHPGCGGVAARGVSTGYEAGVILESLDDATAYGTKRAANQR